MDCSETELAIEKRLRGKLDARETAQVEAHLASCSACRAFAAMAEEMDMTMRQLSSGARGGLDWLRIDRQYREHLTRDKYRLLVSAASIVLFGLIVFRRPGHLPSWILLIGLVLFAIVFAVRSYWTFRFARAANAPGELLVAYRKRLDRWIAYQSAVRFLAPVLGIACLVFLYVQRHALADGMRGFLSGLAAGAFLGGLVAQLYYLPKARRERAQLE